MTTATTQNITPHTTQTQSSSLIATIISLSIFYLITLLTFFILLPPISFVGLYAGQPFSASRIMRDLSEIYSFFFEPVAFNIPPIIYFVILFAILLPIFALILTPRIAAPYTSFFTTYLASFKRTLLITFPFYIIIAIFLFSLVLPNILTQNTRDRLENQWLQQNPRPTSNLNGKITAWQAEYSKYNINIYRLPEIERINRIGQFITAGGAYLAILLFLTLLRLATYNRPYILKSHWPATCEQCNYNIFTPPPSTDAPTSQEHQTHCTECGSEIILSIPPIHRIDDPISNASSLPQKILALITLTSLFLFKPTTLAKRLRINDPSSSHHAHARLALALILPLSIITTILLFSLIQILDPNTPSLPNPIIDPEPYLFFAPFFICVTYLTIQLLAFFNSLLLFFYRKPNLHFAMKLANLAAFPIFTIINLYLTLLISLTFFYATSLGQAFISLFPSEYVGNYSFNATTAIVLGIILPAWLISNTHLILKQSRFSNA
ncbi:hypothetical protein JD969_10075 [Planctomycetota bacterium]|nr:hypothetical protein JD969_10075 [Planctomycetota bacterium]